MLVFWNYYASIFFSKFFHLQPHSHLPWLNFTVFLCWKYSIVIFYMHILSKISHTFKPNQAPNVASSVGYIISCMSRPLHKILSSCTGTQNARNNLSNHYQTTVRHDTVIFFQFLKFLRLPMQPLLSKWHLWNSTQ